MVIGGIRVSRGKYLIFNYTNMIPLNILRNTSQNTKTNFAVFIASYFVSGMIIGIFLELSFISSNCYVTGGLKDVMSVTPSVCYSFFGHIVHSSATTDWILTLRSFTEVVLPLIIAICITYAYSSSQTSLPVKENLKGKRKSSVK